MLLIPVIRVTRSTSGARDRWRAYRVLVDGQERGRLRRGDSIDVAVPPGRHEVRIRIDWTGSPPLALDVPRGSTVLLRCEPHSAFQGRRDLFRAQGWVTLRRIGTVREHETAPVVDLSLWQADAVVLHDWLMSADLDAVPVTHPAQKQALADLLNALERDTDVAGSTAQEIAAAQAEVAKDMGW